MSSNEDFKSPVTPTAALPSNQSAAHKPFRRSYDQKMDLRRDIIERESEDLYLPAFTTKQLNFCREALKRLKMKKADTGRRLIDREFETMTVHRLKSYEAIGRMKAAQLNVNMRKNRYVDVLPFDETRVVLNVPSGGPDTAFDYINASYIVDSSNDKLPTFIATQGPLRSTVGDFWEMIFQQRCPVIVMLTSLLDGNQEKCAPYFPVQVHQSRVYGNWCITTKSLNYSRHSIAKRVLEVQSSELPSVSHTVLHCEYLHWPDNHVPPSTRPIRELFRCLLNVPIDAGPFVVHCSAGIGRTGTYCTIDHTLRRILDGDESALDIMNTVGRFREQRVGMVQTREQYHFCYEAVIDELEALLQLSMNEYANAPVDEL